MLSPTDSICSGGGTDGGSDGESGLDLLQDKDGNSDESSRYQTGCGVTQQCRSGLTGKVVISSSKSDMMRNGVNTPAHGAVTGKGVGRSVVMVL
nr:hypothetical protein [Tanacetum cinerariifolium]